MTPRNKTITLMTRDEANSIAHEIIELVGHEMYDTLEKNWVTVKNAEAFQGKMDKKLFYVCVELKLDNEDSIMTVPYDYFREHVQESKLD